MKLLPEKVPKISTTQAQAATNASRHAGDGSRFGRNAAASNASITAIMTAHFKVRHRFSTSTRLAPRNAVIPDSTCHALWNECARKNTHPKQVRWKTRKTRNAFETNAGTRSARTMRWYAGPISRGTTRYDPCSAPQKTYVQLAPCHSPPSSMV